jgi:hypothetical protein
MDSQAIIGAVEGVMKAWCKQRKAEERQASRVFHRRVMMVRSHRTTIRESAFAVMQPAYLAASSNNTLPAHARQIFYRARGPVQAKTGRTLDDQYFTQTLLPDYLMANPQTTRTWDVVFDARGHFTEPHTRVVVPLGTLDVRSYLAGVQRKPRDEATLTDLLFPTCGPKNRYSAILFIEKEGFLPLFQRVRLAERFDIAIMSTKGMSVTASRLLVDRLCAEHRIPLLVLHDFDKSGFSIASTLQRDTRRYEFFNSINVVDLGLRLTDVREWELVSESVAYGKSDPTWNLRENGATDEEIAFLCDKAKSSWQHHVGQRVELNAFSSADLVKWIEDKLKEHGIKKVVPDPETLEAAYRRALANVIIERDLDVLSQRAKEQAQEASLPNTLAEEIVARQGTDPAKPWDELVAELATVAIR